MAPAPIEIAIAKEKSRNTKLIEAPCPLIAASGK